MIATDHYAHMEELAAGIVLVCSSGNALNNAIAVTETAGLARDTAYFAALGITGRDPILVERIPNENMFYGHRPTLMERPSDTQFPALSALCFEQSAGGDTSMDQMFGVELIADCELLIKAGPIQRGDYSYIAEDILAPPF